MTYTITEKGATILLDGRVYMISKSSPDWALITTTAVSCPKNLGQILTPEKYFSVGQRWNTRAGGHAVVTNIEGRGITVLIDDWLDVETTAGMVSPGTELDDDLMELVA